MKTFSIEAGDHSPEIYIDEAKQLVEISGNSTLKDTNWFYSNLLKWILAFNTGTAQTKVFNIKLNRINDSSSKWIGIIFNKLAALLPGTSGLEINWYVHGRSTRSLAVGQMLKDQNRFQVNLLS